jgi:hypothetical protein
VAPPPCRQMTSGTGGGVGDGLGLGGVGLSDGLPSTGLGLGDGVELELGLGNGEGPGVIAATGGAAPHALTSTMHAARSTILRIPTVMEG